MPVSSTLTRNIALALAIASTGASAQQLDYALRTGIRHSDNINQSSTNPISQNVLVPGFDFTFQQQGSTLQANVAGNVEYRDYLGNAFDSQTLAQLSGQANWTILPQRLDFAVLDYAGVQPLSTLSTNVPTNQQQTNVLVLGPTLRFRVTDTLRGQAELRYTNSYASKTTDFDSSRGMAALRLLKDLSPTTHLSANIDTERVTFQHTNAGPAYNRTELFGRYVSQFTRVDLDTALGWSQINFDRAPNVSTPLLRFSMAWRPTLRSTFRIDAARQVADAAQDLLGQTAQNPINGIMSPYAPSLAQPNIGTGGAVITSEVYIERRLEASYAFIGQRLTFRVAPLYRKFDYVNDPGFNQTGRGGSIGIDYRLSERTTLWSFANTEAVRYSSLARRDKNTSYGIGLTDEMTAHWSWTLSVVHDLRSSNVADVGFHANEIYLGVVYRR